MTITSTSYAVADIAALKALTGLPASGSGLYYARYVNKIGWYQFDPDATTGGIAPDVGTGQWFPIQQSFVSGTTAQRPVSPPNFTERFNTSLRTFEHYINGTWVKKRVGTNTQVLRSRGGVSLVNQATAITYDPSRQEVGVLCNNGLTFIAAQIDALVSTRLQTNLSQGGNTDMIYVPINDRYYLFNGNSQLRVVQPTDAVIETSIQLTGDNGGSLLGVPVYYSASNNRIYIGLNERISIVNPSTNTEVASLLPLDPENNNLRHNFTITEKKPIDVNGNIYFGGVRCSMVVINKSNNTFAVIARPNGFPSNYTNSGSTGFLVYLPTINQIAHIFTSSNVTNNFVAFFDVATNAYTSFITLPNLTFYGSRLPCCYVPSTDQLLIAGQYIFSVDVQTKQLRPFYQFISVSPPSSPMFFCPLNNLVLFAENSLDPYTLGLTSVSQLSRFFIDLSDQGRCITANLSLVSYQ